MIWSYQESASNWSIWRPPSFLKACTASIFFVLPCYTVPPQITIDRNGIQTDQIHSLLMLTERGGTGAGRGSFINGTGESSGDSLLPSQPLHQEDQKTWSEHFLWKLVMCRRQQQMTAMKHKTYHHLMPFKCPSFLTLQHFSCNFPCSIPPLRRAHLLSDWFFFPTLSTCPEGISWVIKNIRATIQQVVWSCSWSTRVRSPLTACSPFLEFSPFLLLGLHYNIKNLLILFLCGVMTSFSYLFLYQALY